MAFETQRAVLDRPNYLELVLELPSFSGGENTISEDHGMKANEARVLENWDAESIAGMLRAKGFTRVARGTALNQLTRGSSIGVLLPWTYAQSRTTRQGVPIGLLLSLTYDGYTVPADLLVHHTEGANDEVYMVINGDLVRQDGDVMVPDDVAAFSKRELCHAVSAGGSLWITNGVDNLKRKKIGVALTTPADKPTEARHRIYAHKFRLLAEGGGRRVYGSRSGVGNWIASDAWSKANDAWNIDLPDDTQGCAPEFPSGDEDLVFTRFGAYALSNFPNVLYRPIANSRGCEAPYSIVVGDEGVFFASRYPTIGIYLYDRTQFLELTPGNRDVFPERINFDQRVFGIYRNRHYYLMYNELGSGASYPNRLRIYDTRLGRWMARPVNAAVEDHFGYPALLKQRQNELYVASARGGNVYQLDTSGNTDAGENTEAVYRTKGFTSSDFGVGTGGAFPIDEVRLKLVKFTLTYLGQRGTLALDWDADFGRHKGTKTIDLTGGGDLLNTTFTMNQSTINQLPDGKTITLPFPNDAVGRRFQFTLTNKDMGTRPEIKKLKIHALALEEF